MLRSSSRAVRMTKSTVSGRASLIGCLPGRPGRERKAEDLGQAGSGGAYPHNQNGSGSDRIGSERIIEEFAKGVGR